MAESGNPFLISPPPGLLPPAPAAQPAEEQPAEQEAVPRAAPTAPGPTASAHTTSTVSLPARPGSRGFATPTPAAVFGGALAEPDGGPARRWTLRLADGRAVPLTGAVYLGRNPVTGAEHPQAELLAVQDERRSVSKTHALLVADSDGVLVHDLGSTNGTWVVAEDGAERQALPGAPIRLSEGGRIELGELSLQLTAD